MEWIERGTTVKVVYSTTWASDEDCVAVPHCDVSGSDWTDTNCPDGPLSTHSLNVEIGPEAESMANDDCSEFHVYGDGHGYSVAAADDSDVVYWWTIDSGHGLCDTRDPWKDGCFPVWPPPAVDFDGH